MHRRSSRIVLLAFVALSLLSSSVEATSWSRERKRQDESLYQIGVGIHDITGPSAGVNLMGYANPSQIAKGIHMRLFSRAFVVDDGEKRVVFVSADCGMMGQLVKIKVMRRLEETFGDLYVNENVILSGTHTHSGPAGFLQYLLFDITSAGFIDATLQAMVEGIYQSIVKAHNNTTTGYIYVSSGDLLDASINRSPPGYDNNPEEEKAKYAYNTDKTMTLLRFVDTNNKDLGMLNWFAVHPTSMNNTNPLISGDNKGYASQLFEERMNPDSMPGQGPFVAAFAQSNCGDVSPNTKGPKCIDTGLPCDILTSTCGGKSHKCIASGPGKDMMESTKIIGEKQFDKAWELYHSGDAVKLSGPIQTISQFVDMGNYTVTLKDGRKRTTCEPALGYSFAAGTIDGPGAFDFTQGMTEESPFWNAIVNFIVPTRPQQEECHAPKPILLDTGNYNRPYPWHPRIMETQIGRIGQLFILAVPGEFTTMSGRRIRNKITELAGELGVSGAFSVVAGLSNVYSHYIATREEYDIQRYEAASTIFGPHTLEAYIQQYSYILDAMLRNQSISAGPSPPDLYDQQMSLVPGILFDSSESQKDFGEVVAQPYPLAFTGETQIAKFVAGHPRNNVRLGSTFLTVERKVGNEWKVIATDASWQTRFVWDRTSTLLGTSEATVYWDIPVNTSPGIYRIKHFGDRKSFSTNKVTSYEGTTEPFKVETARARTDYSYEGPIKINTSPFSWLQNLFGK